MAKSTWNRGHVGLSNAYETQPENNDKLDICLLLIGQRKHRQKKKNIKAASLFSWTVSSVSGPIVVSSDDNEETEKMFSLHEIFKEEKLTSHFPSRAVEG